MLSTTQASVECNIKIHCMLADTLHVGRYTACWQIHCMLADTLHVGRYTAHWQCLSCWRAHMMSSFLVAFVFFRLESTDLCFCWVCSQVVSHVVGVELVECICEYLLNFSKACILASYTQVLGIQKPLNGLILRLLMCVDVVQERCKHTPSPVADQVLQATLLPLKSTKKQQFVSRMLRNSVSCGSSVNSRIFVSSRGWLTVSYAAVKSTNTTPVLFFMFNPSSICCVRFRSCLVVDLPDRKPACCLINRSSMKGERRLRRRHSSNLKV